MSPEQARGETRLLDGRSDLYSLGVILFELLTGRLPFQYRNPTDLLEQIRHREVRSLRSIDDSIPNKLDEICLKCLSKDIRNRYATGRDLATDLDRWNRSKGHWRQAVLIAGGVVVFAVTVVTIIMWASFWPRRNDRLDAAAISLPIAAAEQPAAGSEPPTAPAGQYAPGQWQSMLDHPLEKVVFLKGRQTDFLQQDIATNSLTARSEVEYWILATRHHGKVPLRIRGLVFMDDWVGNVGFVWGLSQPHDVFPKQPPRCFACLIERISETEPLTLAFHTVKTKESLPDVLCVGSLSAIAITTIDVPKTAISAFEVAIDKRGLTVLIDGIVIWTPEVAEKHVLDELSAVDGRVGVLVRGKTVGIRDAAIKFFDSQTLLEGIP